MRPGPTASDAGSPAELWEAPTVYRPGLFAGKVALVSGGGSGIGRACALLFARLGAAVVVCGRTAGRLDATAQFLAGHGAEVLARPTDIRDVDAVARLYAAIHARFGRLDCVINNAGGQFPGEAIDLAPKGWKAVIDNNLNGTWWMMQRAAQYWRDARMPGAIVNIVVVVDRGIPGVAHTVAARAGVIGVTRTVAVEWAPLGIRVNCVAPGLIDSGALGAYPPAARHEFSRANPMRRTGLPMDVAEACVYLAADSARFVTGEILTVDGGGRLWGELWTAGRPEYFR